MNNKLTLPAHCTILSEEELCTVEGGGILSAVLYAFGRMFRDANLSKGGTSADELEQAHGNVVSYADGVTTYSDGYKHYESERWSLNVGIGDIFYGLGDLLSAFGL